MSWYYDWGKLIICKFHNGVWMTSSLGMTGNWTIEERKHNHVELVLESGYSLYFIMIPVSLEQSLFLTINN